MLPMWIWVPLDFCKVPQISRLLPQEMSNRCFALSLVGFFFFFLPDEMNIYSVQTNFTGNLQLQAYLVGTSSSGMDSSERKYHQLSPHLHLSLFLDLLLL